MSGVRKQQFTGIVPVYIHTLRTFHSLGSSKPFLLLLSIEIVPPSTTYWTILRLRVAELDGVSSVWCQPDTEKQHPSVLQHLPEDFLSRVPLGLPSFLPMNVEDLTLTARFKSNASLQAHLC